ncbi:MAG: sigma-54-dependent Fis family transcriptional regulator [Candidatus Cloacimonetes bacterium]|nr:sigma-54-dependent Fis family transcriptional regulator [Candidatus Cloacimonadota bacterium]
MSKTNQFQFNVLWLDDEAYKEDDRNTQLREFLLEQIEAIKYKVTGVKEDQQSLFCNDASIEISKRKIDLLTSKGLNPSFQVNGISISKFDLILLDVNFGEGRETLGLDLLKALDNKQKKRLKWTAPIVLLANIDSAAIPQGSENLIEDGTLLQLINKNSILAYLHSKQSKKDILTRHLWDVTQLQKVFKDKVQQKYNLWLHSLDSILIDGDEVDSYIQRIQDQAIDVIITGQSGTGKEQVFNKIAEHYPKEKVVKVNCAGINKELFEIEFFGYSKGSFTGADSDRMGFCESADGGVLFLDEIAELELSTQAKLLRVLQERQVRRVGEIQESRSADFRLIAATNKDLVLEVKEGRFREDLFFRLITNIRIELKPLHQRNQDISCQIIQRIFSKVASKLDKSNYTISQDLLDYLSTNKIQGNIRSIEGILESMLSLKQESSELRLSDIPNFAQILFDDNLFE